VEMIVVVAIFVGVALAAIRWGQDSRPAPRSREWEQAMLGLVWGRDEVAPVAHVRPESARPALSTAMRVRRLDAERRATCSEAA
jgi:hypothetical protein